MNLHLPDWAQEWKDEYQGDLLDELCKNCGRYLFEHTEVRGKNDVLIIKYCTTCGEVERLDE